MAEVPETDTRPDRTRNRPRRDRLAWATLAVAILGHLVVPVVIALGSPATTPPGPASVTVVCAAAHAQASGDLS
ncbi:hypothetical protein [Streptomyces parvus]|uniref:hypothetical protein n=1 Tax=Streptomyces parvus TaxID=66428 RepID=UPI0037141288